MTEAQKLILDMERAASALGMSPSTIGALAGQGGRFYSRLLEGRRCWPETAARVRATIDRIGGRGSTPSPNDNTETDCCQGGNK